MKFKEAVTYDDMLLVPQYSDITSRSEVDIQPLVGHRAYNCPSIASPMDTVSELIWQSPWIGRWHGCSSSLQYHSRTRRAWLETASVKPGLDRPQPIGVRAIIIERPERCCSAQMSLC